MEQFEDENYALEKLKARNEYEMKMLKEDHANKMNAKLNEFVKEFDKSKSGILQYLRDRKKSFRNFFKIMLPTGLHSPGPHESIALWSDAKFQREHAFRS